MGFTDGDIDFVVGLQEVMREAAFPQQVCSELLSIALKIAEVRGDVRKSQALQVLIKERENG